MKKWASYSYRFIAVRGVTRSFSHMFIIMTLQHLRHVLQKVKPYTDCSINKNIIQIMCINPHQEMEIILISNEF